MVDIAEVKQFLRISENDNYDDLMIGAHIGVAEEYLKNAGVLDVKKVTNIYDLAIKMIVKALYDEEDFTRNQGLKAIIAQLVYS